MHPIRTKTRLQLWLSWLDDHILALLGGFLLAFIPLYPKLPLFEAIPGYIVRVRLEDVLILISGLVWLIWLIRGKISFKTPLTKMIVAYAGVGLLSVMLATFLINTIPREVLHVGKSMLHFFRYGEYFFLFFLIYTGVRTRKHAISFIVILVITVLLISLYGLGQKFWYWPVYSTMNREFSKGVRLYLTEHARVQSTFGGHYDLGAYLALILPILAALSLKVHRRWRWGLHSIFWFGVWLLMVSASRSSFLAFVVSIAIVIWLLRDRLASKKSQLRLMVLRGCYFGIGSILLMAAFGSDLSERLFQSLDSNPTFHVTYHNLNGKRKYFFNEYLPIKLGLKMPYPTVPSNGISTDEALNIIVKSDQNPSTGRPSDVYVNVPITTQVSTISANGDITITSIDQQRTYSANALKYGLSLAIRLDTLWPRAIAGFWRNPLTGSGYATLTKESVGQFTEAESTDNNFLRTLGETGLLGFLTFYGAMGIALFHTLKALQKPLSTLDTALLAGFVAGTAALLANALYIDVFASSKVAFTYWGIVGLVLAVIKLNSAKSLKGPRA